MENNKKEIAKEAMKVINEIEESIKIENIIQDNRIKFIVEEKTYRVSRPNVQEQEIIDNYRRQKYSALVDDDSYYFRKQWIEKYSKKGIDINKMEENIIKLQDNVKKLLLRLSSETGENNVQTIKKEILKLREEQQDINTEKVDLMMHCIEDQLVIETNSYTSYMVLERFENDKWAKHFKTFEEYNSCKDWTLLNRMYYYINILIYETEI